MENVRKYSYIKLVTTAAKRNYLITKKLFSETILATDVRNVGNGVHIPSFLGG